jgi:hypothetical protein
MSFAARPTTSGRNALATKYDARWIRNPQVVSFRRNSLTV